MISSIKKRIEDIEKRVSGEGETILRIIRKHSDGFIISYSPNKKEIGLILKNLDQLDKLKRGKENVVTIIDDIDDLVD